MIHKHIFHNDKLLLVEDARISPGQGGYLCGYGIFTTTRILHSEVFAYERHWRRLEKDAGILRLALPYPADIVHARLQELIRKNQVEDGCARIYFVQNAIGYWRSDEPQPAVDLLLCTADAPQFRDPVRLTVRPHGRHAASLLAGVKSISWLPNVWAVSEAVKEGFDEVILLNERGEVTECTACNIFALKNGKIYTPPLDSGCLEGVTRSVLLEIAPKAGFPVIEQALRPEDLYDAEEVLVTSSNRNLVGVSEIAGHSIGMAAPGPVTRQLDRLFEEYIQDYVQHKQSRVS